MTFLVFHQLLKKEEEAKDKPVERACAQLISCLIDHVLKLEAVAGKMPVHFVKIMNQACHKRTEIKVQYSSNEAL